MTIKDKNLRQRYNITESEFNSLLNSQSGCCYICETRFEGTICVDHCHITGDIRGLACNKCNSGIAFLGDNPWDVLERSKSFAISVGLSLEEILEFLSE